MRAPRRGSTPLVSVVVVSNGDGQRLLNCLPTIIDECARVRAEVVVARAAIGPAIDLWARSYPTVGFIEGPASATIGQLRALGMREATGDIVVFVDDATEFDAERLAACVRGPRDAAAAAGENGGRVEIDWAACLARYGVTLPSAGPAAPTDRLDDARIPASPLISIIIPAHQGGATLRTTLTAIVESDLPREIWELIIVDDASADDTPLIAAEFADSIVRLPARHGPAYARNRGVEVSRGAIIVFFDADVRPHADALRSMLQVFATEPDVSAVFGAYDTMPTAPGFVSQYRNLLHHYVHWRSAGEAETFWAGCGAVRRDAFLAAGMYDEWRYTRPQIEDVELGHRMRALGHRILLVPTIQCSHMKRWRLRDVIRADFKDRGVPWTRLLIQLRAMSRTTALNLANVEKLNTILLCTALALLVTAGVVGSRDFAWIAAALLGFVIAVNIPLYAFFRRQRGLLFAIGVIPLHMLYYLNNAFAVAYGWLVHHTIGEPAPDALTQAYAEVGVQMWPPVRSRGRIPGQ